MTNKEDHISEKLQEIVGELKRSGLWLESGIPAWVHQFEQQGCASANVGHTANDKKFIEWLRFIYIPNCMAGLGEKSQLSARQFIAPQAARVFAKDTTKAALLKLLIELDALI